MRCAQIGSNMPDLSLVFCDDIVLVMIVLSAVGSHRRLVLSSPYVHKSLFP